MTNVNQPVNVTLIMSSTAGPWSGYYRLNGIGCHPTYRGGLVCHVAVNTSYSTTTDDEVRAFDALMYGRAAGGKWLGNDAGRTVVIPTTTYSSNDADLSLSIESVEIYQNSSHTAPALIYLIMGSVTYYDYSNNTYPSGAFPEQIFTGEIFTVVYDSTGFAQKVQFKGANLPANQRWVRVPGTLTYNGKAYTPPPRCTDPNRCGPIQRYGSTEAQDQYTNGKIATQLDVNSCSGGSSLTVVNPDGSGNDIVSFGTFNFPC